MDASPAITIEREGDGARGAYVMTLPDMGGRAELAWFDRNGVRHAHHTFVPADMRGQGIAARLVDALIADARERGFRIAPDCSYVATVFRRHPEWADLRA